MINESTIQQINDYLITQQEYPEFHEFKIILIKDHQQYLYLNALIKCVKR